MRYEKADSLCVPSWIRFEFLSVNYVEPVATVVFLDSVTRVGCMLKSPVYCAMTL